MYHRCVIISHIIIIHLISLKGQEAFVTPRKQDIMEVDKRLQAENEKGMIQRQISMPTRLPGGQPNLLSLSPRQNLSKSSENINETPFDSAKSGLRNTTVKPAKSKFVPVTNGNCSPRERTKANFNRPRSRKFLDCTRTIFSLFFFKFYLLNFCSYFLFEIVI